MEYLFFCREMTVLHLTRMACLIPLRDTGDGGLLSSPSFAFLNVGSFVSLATNEKSEITM